MWSDADWCGDSEDTKSTFGLVLELLHPNSGRRWSISWAVRMQGSTSNSTAEDETDTLGEALGWAGDEAVLAAEARRDHPGDELAQRAQSRAGEHACETWKLARHYRLER